MTRKPATVEDRSAAQTEDGRPILTAPVNLVFTGESFRLDGTFAFHVHAAGCADLKRGGYRGLPDASPDAEVEVSSLKDVVEDVYRYGGSFYAEAGIPESEHEDAWRGYAGEFRVFPCLSLPDEPVVL